MARFRFSMIEGDTETAKIVVIPNHELEGHPSINLPGYREIYRRNVIRKHLEKWALSTLKLTWEECADESDTHRPDCKVAESETQEAHER